MDKVFCKIRTDCDDGDGFYPEWHHGTIPGFGYWVLYSDFTLVVDGRGEMPDWDCEYVPWSPYRTEIRSVRISQGVSSIGNCAFENCRSLVRVTMWPGIERIGKHAFYRCIKLQEITLPNTLKILDTCVFANCSSLERIDLPNGLKIIRNGVFIGCSNLKYMRVPDSLRSVNDSTVCHFLNSAKVIQSGKHEKLLQKQDIEATMPVYEKSGDHPQGTV